MARRNAGRGASKYGNLPTEYEGMKFQSKSEAAYARQLDLAMKAGAIRGWSRQVPFMLGVPENKYVTDFLVWENDGSSYAIDVKGMETPKFRRDKLLWSRYAPIELRIITGGKLVETIVPECMMKGAA